MEGYRAATEAEIEEKLYDVAYEHVGGENVTSYQMIPLNMRIRIRRGRRYVLRNIAELKWYKGKKIDYLLLDLAYGGFEQYYCLDHDELVICRDKVAVAGYVAEQVAPRNYIHRWHKHVFAPHVDTDETWITTLKFVKVYRYEVDEALGTTVALYY